MTEELGIYGGKPTRKKYLQFSEPDIKWSDIRAALSAIRSGWLSTGKRTSEFEKAFAVYKQTGNALALNSCTAALHLSLLALQLSPKSEVITTDMTFGATIMSILHAGLKPVLIDCNSSTSNIDAYQIEKKITNKTKAILVVHFAGYPCDMNPILDLCEKYNLYLIEDCAHAIEAQYHGQHVGTFGNFGCFSFYGTKNITTTVGEGGMLLSKEFNDRVRFMSLHGMSKGAAERYSGHKFQHYDIFTDGWKYNMPDVSAAFALNQLKRIDKSWKKRQQIWQRYRYEFSDEPLVLPIDPPPIYGRHAYHLFSFRLHIEDKDKRDKFLHAMAAENIGVGVHYRAIHQQSYFRRILELNPSDYPVAEMIGNTTISIPLTARLTNREVTDVIKAVKKVSNYLL